MIKFSRLCTCTSLYNAHYNIPLRISCTVTATYICSYIASCYLSFFSVPKLSFQVYTSHIRSSNMRYSWYTVPVSKCCVVMIRYSIVIQLVFYNQSNILINCVWKFACYNTNCWFVALLENKLKKPRKQVSKLLQW